MSSSFERSFTTTGPDHKLPLYTNAFPPTSPATQNDDDAHDSALRLFPVVSTGSGALHVVPLKVNALPAKSMAAQNDANGQETEMSGLPPALGSMKTGVPQELPLNVCA